MKKIKDIQFGLVCFEETNAVILNKKGNRVVFSIESKTIYLDTIYLHRVVNQKSENSIELLTLSGPKGGAIQVPAPQIVKGDTLGGRSKMDIIQVIIQHRPALLWIYSTRVRGISGKIKVKFIIT